jgi:hypothetical protein
MSALLRAASAGDLSSVQRLLEEGASLAETDDYGCSALLLAAEAGALPTVIWLITKGGSDVSETSAGRRHTALLLSAANGQLMTVQWLLEHGGSSIEEQTTDGESVWDLLKDYLLAKYEHDWAFFAAYDAATVTGLLRVLVLLGAPPRELAAELSLERARVVEEGARLRARLPAYFARQRFLLDEHCLLIPPLRDLVRGYEETATTEELWATGLGAGE